MNKQNDKRFKIFRDKILSREKTLITVPTEAVLSVALVFPNAYEVGMSNLGFQSIYRLFNEFPGVRCERAFYDANFPTSTRSLESFRELRDFDVVAFSVAFEMDFPNIVTILMNAGITPFSSQRHHREPLIIAGGAISLLNPLPIESFIDFFLVGEIEPHYETILNALLQQREKGSSKRDLLEFINEIPSVYVPELRNSAQKIERSYSPPQNRTPQYSAILSPDSHFKNMFLIEVGRGCGRHCYFCAASHIYHPFRIFSADNIMTTIEQHSLGTKRVGLIGSALSDYPRLHDLCGQLVEQGFELGLSSFRLDMINDSFLNILEQGKVKTLTLAPETGTERMRKIINKDFTDDQIYEAMRVVAASKINQVKLYFLLGLPQEQWEDIEGIIHLVKESHRILQKKGSRKKLTVSTNAFIPKPFTPFQWSALESASEIRRKRKYLEREIKKIPGVQFTRKSVKEEVLQAIFSLGDRRIGESIFYKISHKTDWNTAWQKTGVNIDEICYQPKESNHQFPWDFIAYGIKKDVLLKKWQKISK